MNADATEIGRESHNRAVMDAETFLRGLFAILDAHGVEYLVMRNYEGYPYQMHKPDVGLLISHRQVEKLVRAFRDMCWRMGWEWYLETWRRQNVVLHAVESGPVIDGQTVVRTCKVDARTCEVFATGSGYAPAYRVFLDEVRRRRVTRDGCSFVILDQPDEFIFLVKQWKRKNTGDLRRRVLEKMQSAAVDAWLREAVGADAKVVAAGLSGAFGKREDDLLAQMVRRRWGPNTVWRILRCWGRTAATRLRRAWWLWGPMIYLTGPDGCGKTTAIKGVQRMLEQSGVRSRYFYSLKRVVRFVTRRLAWLKFRAAGGRDAAQFAERLVNTEHADRDTGGWYWRFRKKLALLTGLLDIAISYCLAVPYRLRGYVVLVETSPYDVFIKYHMPEFPVLERILAPLLPKPSACCVLRASPEAVFRRKAELRPDEIVQYYSRLERVLERAGIGAARVDIDTHAGAEATIVKVWRTTMKALSESQQEA